MRTILILAVISGVGYLGISAGSAIEMPTMREELAAKRAVAQNRSPYDEAWDNFKANLFAEKFTQYAESLAVVTEAINKLAPSHDWPVATKCLGGREQCEQELARAFVLSAKKFSLPPLLLVAMARYESNLYAFDRNGLPIRGSRGELGLLQLHGPPAQGCDFGTLEGQATCGARYVRQKLDKHEYIIEAMTAYACGQPRSGNHRTNHWVVPRRIILWQALERKMSAKKLREIISLGVRRQATFNFREWGSYQDLYQPWEV